MPRMSTIASSTSRCLVSVGRSGAIELDGGLMRGRSLPAQFRALVCGASPYAVDLAAIFEFQLHERFGVRAAKSLRSVRVSRTLPEASPYRANMIASNKGGFAGSRIAADEVESRCVELVEGHLDEAGYGPNALRVRLTGLIEGLLPSRLLPAGRLARGRVAPR